MSPQRIQRKRTKGWRMPEGAVYVGRPGVWGNPFKVGSEVSLSGYQHDGLLFDGITIPMTAEMAVAAFRVEMIARITANHEDTHPDDIAYVTEWRDALAQLRGRDLACWCPLDGQPCHADVLLELANGAAL